MKPKQQKRKREGPIRIPLPFEEAVSDLLKVKPEAKRKRDRRSGRTKE